MKIYRITVQDESAPAGYRRIYASSKAEARSISAQHRREYREGRQLEREHTRDGFCSFEYRAGADPDPQISAIELQATKRGIIQTLNREAEA